MRQLPFGRKLSHVKKAVSIQTEILFIIRFGFRLLLVSRYGGGHAIHNLSQPGALKVLISAFDG